MIKPPKIIMTAALTTSHELFEKIIYVLCVLYSLAVVRLVPPSQAIRVSSNGISVIVCVARAYSVLSELLESVRSQNRWKYQ